MERDFAYLEDVGIQFWLELGTNVWATIGDLPIFRGRSLPNWVQKNTGCG
jgi:hypothetical protein